MDYKRFAARLGLSDEEREAMLSEGRTTYQTNDPGAEGAIYFARYMMELMLGLAEEIIERDAENLWGPDLGPRAETVEDAESLIKRIATLRVLIKGATTEVPAEAIYLAMTIGGNSRSIQDIRPTQAQASLPSRAAIVPNIIAKEVARAAKQAAFTAVQALFEQATEVEPPAADDKVGKFCFTQGQKGLAWNAVQELANQKFGLDWSSEGGRAARQSAARFAERNSRSLRPRKAGRPKKKGKTEN